MNTPFSLSKTRVVAWTVWLVASFFYAYQYILRVLPDIMLTDIIDQFGISAATFGQFSGVYYIGYYNIIYPRLGFCSTVLGRGR